MIYVDDLITVVSFSIVISFILALLPEIIWYIYKIYRYIADSYNRHLEKKENINKYLDNHSYILEELEEFKIKEDNDSFFYINDKSKVLMEYKNGFLYVSRKCTRGEITKDEMEAIKIKYQQLFNKAVSQVTNISHRLTIEAEGIYKLRKEAQIAKLILSK